MRRAPSCLAAGVRGPRRASRRRPTKPLASAAAVSVLSPAATAAVVGDGGTGAGGWAVGGGVPAMVSSADAEAATADLAGSDG